MTVLVTGGAGYIGSHMAHALRDAGRDVVIIDNLSTGFKFLAPSDVPLVVGDVGDRALVANILEKHNVDSVIHFAGSIVVPESIAHPLRYYDNNTAKSGVLIDTCIGAGIEKFIFSSTAAVYGSPEQSPVSETFPLEPISPYGSSKLMTEWMLRDAAAVHNFNYVALRYFNVAGADLLGRSGQASADATHLIKIASQTALGTREKMEVYGDDYDTPDGTCIRDYIHVSDLVSAHLSALSYLEKGGNSSIFNCGYGRGASVLEVIAAVEQATGNSLNVSIAPRRAGDPPELVANAEKLRSTLSWSPRHEDINEIVTSALNWERSLLTKC